MSKKKTKTLENILEETQEINRSNRCSYESMKRQFSSLVRQFKETNKTIVENCLKQTEYLKSLEKSNENVNETLLNVLLAIRQNEYLQAWYPEQHGFPEMKVSGTHPAKLMKVKDGQSNQSRQEIA